MLAPAAIGIEANVVAALVALVAADDLVKAFELFHVLPP
jgi:hypothetical protein